MHQYFANWLYMYHIECVVSDYWPGRDHNMHKLNVLFLNKTVILLSWATKLSSSQYYMNEHRPQSQFDSSSIMLI